MWCWRSSRAGSRTAAAADGARRRRDRLAPGGPVRVRAGRRPRRCRSRRAGRPAGRRPGVRGARGRRRRPRRPARPSELLQRAARRAAGRAAARTGRAPRGRPPRAVRRGLGRARGTRARRPGHLARVRPRDRAAPPGGSWSLDADRERARRPLGPTSCSGSRRRWRRRRPAAWCSRTARSGSLSSGWDPARLGGAWPSSTTLVRRHADPTRVVLVAAVGAGGPGARAARGVRGARAWLGRRPRRGRTADAAPARDQRARRSQPDSTRRSTRYWFGGPTWSPRLVGVGDYAADPTRWSGWWRVDARRPAGARRRRCAWPTPTAWRTAFTVALVPGDRLAADVSRLSLSARARARPGAPPASSSCCRPSTGLAAACRLAPGGTGLAGLRLAPRLGPGLPGLRRAMPSSFLTRASRVWIRWSRASDSVSSSSLGGGAADSDRNPSMSQERIASRSLQTVALTNATSGP